ncbi:RDD family protein [Actinospongicola halichondriae]|uniref:RDD family protein n=1 Tax=Actinospongicola halichondriae TaxID=3236844 RepID=UPI003D523044
MGTATFRHCPRCGGEYQAWVEHCFDCEVALGAPVSSDLAPPTIEATAESDRRTIGVEISDLSPAQHERLRLLLNGLGARFELTAECVWTAVQHADDVTALVEDVRGAPSEDERTSHRRPRGASNVREDRRTVTPPVDPAAVDLSEYASAWPRGLARVIDFWILGAVIALHNLVLEPIPYATGIFMIAMFASFESLFGRTPGKAIVGVRVENLRGAPPSIPAAMLRNSWQLLAFIPVIGAWATLVTQVAIGSVIRRDPMHRGPHDLHAHTYVVRTRDPIRRRLVTNERSLMR